MTLHHLIIQPADVSFFRDGKPFDTANGNTAFSLFPPNPVTFYGALRTAIITQNNATLDVLHDDANSNFKDEIGTSSQKGNLRIADFGIVILNPQLSSFERLFPAPADIVIEKITDQNTIPEVSILSPVKPDYSSDILLNDWLIPHPPANDISKQWESCNGLYMTANSFQKYLRGGRLTESDLLPPDSIRVYDNRTGIRNDNITGTAEEQYLFSTQYIKLKDGYAYYVGLESKLIQKDRNTYFMKLGGDNKAAFITSNQTPDDFNFTINISDRFKLSLITPAIFQKGWIPDCIYDTTNLTGAINNIPVKLVSAVIPKFGGIGGWDLAARKPKPMLRSVPAGAVYHFEFINKPADKQAEIPIGIQDLVMAAKVNNARSNHSFFNEGLGLTITGVW